MRSHRNIKPFFFYLIKPLSYRTEPVKSSRGEKFGSQPIFYYLIQGWPNEAYWNITSGAFHNQISQVPKALIADSLVLFSFIRKVKKMLELYATYKHVCEKLGECYVKGWPPLIPR